MHTANPSQLEDDEWAEEIQSLHFIRKGEEEASKIPT